MTEASVRVDIAADGRASLILNRPDVHNAFDEDMIRRLTEAITALAADPKARVVVLSGAGRSFSAGADLNWMKRMADATPADNLADAERAAAMLRALNGLSKPTVAAVRGAALGGGVGLAACCDIVIAADSAQFAISEVRLGLIPAVISPYVVAAIGERQARRFVLTGERFGAEEAMRIGLVHAVVPADDLDARVAEVVGALLANGPAAMAAAKDLIAAVARRPLDDGLVKDTAARIAAVRVTPEGREGVAAFLAKRKPTWGGK